MKRKFVLTHDQYMLTIGEVVDMIAQLTDGKVVKVGQEGDKLTIEIQEKQSEEFSIYIDVECKMCGCERSLNDEGYCSSCWVIWNS